MESILGRGSNGQAIDLVIVKNAASLAEDAVQVANIDQGYDFTSDGGNVEGVVVIAGNATAAAVAGVAVEVIPTATAALTATTYAFPNDMMDEDDVFNGQTARFFLKDGATLAAAGPISGSTLPASGKFGPKGYVDVAITDSSNSGNTITFDSQTALGTKAADTATTDDACLVDHVAILPGIRLTGTVGGNVAGAAKAIAVVTRER